MTPEEEAILDKFVNDVEAIKTRDDAAAAATEPVEAEQLDNDLELLRAAAEKDKTEYVATLLKLVKTYGPLLLA